MTNRNWIVFKLTYQHVFKSLLCALSLVFSATPALAAASTLPSERESCAYGDISNLGALTAFAEEVIQELIATVEQFSQNGDKKEAICSIKDAVEEELSCEAGADFERLTYSTIHSLLQCINTGTVRKTSWGFEGEVESSKSLARFLALVGFRFTARWPTKETVDILWTCENTQTGEIYSGTLQKIREEYRAYLRSRGKNR